MGSEKVVRRRHYSAELKARVVAECEVPGASVAKVAMSHGINANIVHRWRELRRRVHGASLKTSNTAMLSAPTSFVPTTLPATPSAAAATADIRIEIKRGATTLSMSWPAAAGGECAAWLCEWLR